MDAHEFMARLGPALGLVALTVHAVVDFNHQMPANALLFVTVAALALAPSHDVVEDRT